MLYNIHRHLDYDCDRASKGNENLREAHCLLDRVAIRQPLCHILKGVYLLHIIEHIMSVPMVTASASPNFPRIQTLARASAVINLIAFGGAV